MTSARLLGDGRSRWPPPPPCIGRAVTGLPPSGKHRFSTCLYEPASWRSRDASRSLLRRWWYPDTPCRLTLASAHRTAEAVAVLWMPVQRLIWPDYYRQYTNDG